jgi:hypothetical protein
LYAHFKLDVFIKTNYVNVSAGKKETMPTSGRRWDRLISGSNRNKKSVETSYIDIINTEQTQRIKLLGTTLHIFRRDEKSLVDKKSNSG